MSDRAKDILAAVVGLSLAAALVASYLWMACGGLWSE